MPRKDLEWIKEKGLSSDEVISILKNHFESEESEEVEEEEIEIEEEIEQEEPKTEPEGEPEEPIEQISMDELDQKIDDRIKKVLKIKRKVPSKGEIIKSEDKEEPENIKKNWFEVLV